MSSPEQPPDPIARSALRKASLRLIPLLSVGYGIAFMDRVNISYASLSMNRDLHFSAATYGFGAGLFFLSYAACEIPSNLLLFRFGARRWMARIMFTWGLLAMSMLLVRTPFQFYSVRFLLGMAEAGFFPGILFYVTLWFPKAIRARAISRFYIALPLSSVVMGALAGALLSLDGRFSLHGWQWLFLLEGLPAVLGGFVFLRLLPDSPAHAPWLSVPERDFLLGTLALEAARSPAETHAVGAAIRDERIWQIGLFLLMIQCAVYAYTFSAPAILQASTHLAVTAVGFLISAINILGAAAMLAGAIHSDRTRERYWHIILPTLIAAAAFVLAGLSTRPLLLLPSITVFTVCVYSMQGPVLSIPQSFFTGRSAAAGLAAVNMIAILGGFLGPYAMGLARQFTGTYQRGLLLMSLPMFAATALMLRIRHQALTPAT